MTADNSSVPSLADWKGLWQVLEQDVKAEELKASAITKLLETFRAVYDSGGSEFASFKVPAHPLLDWVVPRSRLAEAIERFVLLPQVKRCAPFQLIREPEAKLELQLSHSLVLDGEIAQALVGGGAYTEFEGSYRDAKDLGVGFCSALFQDRFDDVTVYKTYEPWSRWFKESAWDATWFCFDKRDLRLSVLCITDTD